MIDSSIRREFQFRRPPPSLVEELEARVVLHFGAPGCHQQTLELTEPDKFRRLLVHAISQYHGLLSQTVDRERHRGLMHIRLQAGAAAYHQPRTSLSAWLQAMC